jgi:hypothetical protein
MKTFTSKDDKLLAKVAVKVLSGLKSCRNVVSGDIYLCYKRN